MWKTPVRWAPWLQQRRPQLNGLAALLSDKPAFLQALPDATEKELITSLRHTNRSTDPEIVSRLTDAVRTHLPTFSPSSASDALYDLAGIGGAEPTFEKVRSLLAVKHWDLRERDAAQIVVAFHRAGFRGATFTEGPAILKQYINFDTLSTADLLIVLQALKSISKMNPLSYADMDTLGAHVVNALDNTTYESLVNYFLPWASLRPQCSRSRKRHLAVLQTLVMALRASKVTRLRNVSPMFAPRMRYLISPECELLHEMDSMCFQRLAWGFEAVQCGLPTINVRDWVRVLTCIMDFTVDRLRMYEGKQLPDYVDNVFRTVSREVFNKVTASSVEKPSPNDIASLLELFVRWVPNVDRRRALGTWATGVILALPRDHISNAVSKELAKSLRVCLPDKDYRNWCDAMELVKESLPERLPTRPAPVFRQWRATTAHNAWSSTKESSVAAANQRVIQWNRAVQWASAFEPSEASVTSSPSNPPAPSPVEELAQTAKHMMQRLAHIEEKAHKFEHLAQETTGATTEVDALRKEIEALQSRLSALEKEARTDDSLTSRAKGVLRALTHVTPVQEEEESRSQPLANRFDFDAWLQSQQQRNRNFHDPLSLASFQSQIPRPGR